MAENTFVAEDKHPPGASVIDKSALLSSGIPSFNKFLGQEAVFYRE